MYICDAFSVQKRINTAGLGLLSLERPVCEAGLWLAAGNVTPGAFPTLKGGLAVPRLFLRAAWLVLNMYVLPFGESCTCYAERAGLTGPSTRRRWVSNGPPGAEALHTGCCASLLESVLCVMLRVRVRGGASGSLRVDSSRPRSPPIRPGYASFPCRCPRSQL